MRASTVPAVPPGAGAGSSRVAEQRSAAGLLPKVKRLVRSVMRQVPPEVDADDVFGAACLGLAQALARGRTLEHPFFEAYALTRVRGAIRDHLRGLDTLTRLQRGRLRRFQREERDLGRALGREPTTDELLAAGIMHSVDGTLVTRSRAEQDVEEWPVTGMDAEALLSSKERLISFAKARAKLSPRSRCIVDWYYERDCSLGEIGRRLGISEGRVCQLRIRALEELRMLVGTGRLPWKEQ